MSKPLERDFYDRAPIDVARDLLGAILVRRLGRTAAMGRIVEVEAYLAKDDPANHAFRGPTRRNASMFGPAGHAYVYAIHARYCLNVVTEPEGVASAVLIRAVEPLAGIDVMRRRRRREKLTDLCRGPARLCEAFAIDRGLDGWDVTLGKTLWLEPGERIAGGRIATASRVGVTKAQDLPLRFYVRDCPFVSR
ncbi:MAG TPA: DNA-3-methyladenine glycosylase [Planctomycetaceae bacterium]|nr:DNA-3-methyladenine glycosylase [Planctomycetaceae bacterium]